VQARAATGALAHYRYDHGVAMNDLRVTPGETFSVGVGTICRSGYASSVRDVPESEKLAAYRAYGIASHPTGAYEVDHLISLELGGDNALRNLWPEPNDHPPGYLNSKDILENRLHELVCAGRLPLATAQRSIATDWVAAFHAYLGYWPTGAGHQAVATTTSSAPVASPTSTVAPGATGAVSVTSLASPVAPGALEQLGARARPGASCTLSVTLPSGRVSTASGLGAALVASDGLVSWSWRIGSTTGAGVAVATIECGSSRATASFVVS
jgi:hypothetical protein